MLAACRFMLMVVGLLFGTLVVAQAEDTFACLLEPGPVEIVDGFYDGGKFKPPFEADKKFDARTAWFEYPETISHSMVSIGEKGGSGADDMCWAGGYFTASLSWHDLDISWLTSKQGYDDTESDRGEMNNTTSITAYEDRFTFTGLHVYNMHDGIRTSSTFNNWTVQHVWLDYIRDDCLENDHIHSGTVYDSLFDGCYSGISARPSSSGSGDDTIMSIDRLLLRMEPMPYPYKWDTKDDPVIFIDGYGDVPFANGKIFKLDSGNEPEFSITNSVFVLEYDSEKDLFPPADKVTTCNNNTIIWFGEPAAAPTYLLDDLPGCFTLITDEAEGKALWQEKVTDWHARHQDVGFDRKPENPGVYSWPRYGDGSPPPPPPPDPDPDPDPEPDPDPDPDPEPTVEVLGVDYCGKGGRNSTKHLVSVVTVSDVGVKVEVIINKDDGQSWSNTAITDDAGEVQFRWKNAGTGDFTTEVESLDGNTSVTTPTNGVSWPDNATPCS